MWLEQHDSRNNNSSLAAMSACIETLEPRLLLSASTLEAPELPFGEISTGTDGAYIVYEEYGGNWIDVNKQPPYDDDWTPPGTGDDYLCWAAVISNMLGWTGWGATPANSGTPSALAEGAFDYYQDHWADYPNCLEPTLQWWFDGVDYLQDGTLTDPGGGFFPAVDFGDIFEADFDPTLAMYTAFTSLMAGDSVGVSVTIPGADSGHVFTLWGFDRTFDGYRLYITDSDDGHTGVQLVDIWYDYDQDVWFLEDYAGGYNSWYIRGAYTLDARGLVSDAREPDNTPAEATLIAPDQTPVTQSIHEPDDVDWFRFIVTESTTMEFRPNASDPVLVELFAQSNLTDPAYSQVTSAGQPSLVQTLAAGEYYLRISSPNGDTAIPSYGLVMTEIEPPLMVTLTGYSQGITGDPVMLHANVENAGETVYYSWDFGDGQTDAGIDLDTVYHAYSAPGTYQVSLLVSDGDENATADWTVVVADPPEFTEVLGRYVFYNNSKLDGYNALATGNDDFAIDTRIQPILPDQMATTHSTSAYSRGLNGIMIDILDAPRIEGVSAADFTFEVMSADGYGWWMPAPTPADITVRTGDGTDGSDRVTIIWDDNAIENAWLRITPRESTTTGLSPDDAFIFGNLIGDVDGNGLVDLEDFVGFKTVYGTTGSFLAGDLNASGSVDLNDFVALRTNFGKALPSAAVAASGVNVLAEAQAQPIRFAPTVAGALRRPGTQMLGS